MLIRCRPGKMVPNYVIEVAHGGTKKAAFARPKRNRSLLARWRRISIRLKEVGLLGGKIGRRKIESIDACGFQVSLLRRFLFLQAPSSTFLWTYAVQVWSAGRGSKPGNGRERPWSRSRAWQERNFKPRCGRRTIFSKAK